MNAVGKHFAYLNRMGDLPFETDDGRAIEGRGSEAELLEDWDLDIQEQRPTSTLGARADRNPPKLVHKLMFSMPPGTPPKKVLEAVRMFAREELGATHRYAMVLHTDEPHPHVHMVVKSVSEDGVRLNIRKATLRDWRREFARRLREQGVEANATERAVRGKITSAKSDGIFRASSRGASTYLEERAKSAVREGHSLIRPGAETMARTRIAVERGWFAAARVLAMQGDSRLAEEVRRFAQQLQTPRKNREQQEHRTRS